MTNVVSLEDHVSKAWDAYVAAQRLAAVTEKIEDGKAAGLAWRRWLGLFMTAEQRAFVGDRVSA